MGELLQLLSKKQGKQLLGDYTIMRGGWSGRVLTRVFGCGVFFPGVVSRRQSSSSSLIDDGVRGDETAERE